jgi:hypothetical protein
MKSLINSIQLLPRCIQLEIFKYNYIDYEIMKMEDLYDLMEIFHFISTDEIVNIYNFWRSKYKLKEDTFIYSFTTFNNNDDATRQSLCSHIISSLSIMKNIHNEKIATYKIYTDMINTSHTNENEWLEHIYMLEDDFY